MSDYLELLGSRDYTLLMRKMKIKEAELKPAIELIQQLNPRPEIRQLLELTQMQQLFEIVVR